MATLNTFPRDLKFASDAETTPVNSPAPSGFSGAQTIEDERFVDAETIRRRVAKIKNSWDAETARARAIEGARRRGELAAMFDGLEDVDMQVANHHNFSLVG
jgi:hypothetical protein